MKETNPVDESGDRETNPVDGSEENAPGFDCPKDQIVCFNGREEFPVCRDGTEKTDTGCIDQKTKSVEKF